MPTANRPEITAAELELKRRGRRRLIGALTMGLLAVVVLPMIFDSEPQRKQAARQEIELQIPPKDGQPPLPTPVAPVAAVQNTADKETPALPTGSPIKTEPTAAAADGATSKLQAAKIDAKQEMKVAAKPEIKPEAATLPTSAATPMAGYVIQLGAYKDADNAKALVARMREVKLPVFTDVLPVKTGSVTRVRVGPFPSKEKADGALAQVKLAGVDGKVVPLP
jgi:DedD protein